MLAMPIANHPHACSIALLAPSGTCYVSLSAHGAGAEAVGLGVPMPTLGIANTFRNSVGSDASTSFANDGISSSVTGGGTYGGGGGSRGSAQQQRDTAGSTPSRASMAAAVGGGGAAAAGSNLSSGVFHQRPDTGEQPLRLTPQNSRASLLQQGTSLQRLFASGVSFMA